MNILTYKENDILHKAGDGTASLEYLKSGRVSLSTNGLTITLKEGAILGCLDLLGEPYNYTYTALTDVTLVSFDTISELVESSNFNMCKLVTSLAAMVNSISTKYFALNRNIKNFTQTLSLAYEQYKELCASYQIEVQAFPFLNHTELVQEEELPDWALDYYDQIEIMPENIKESYFGTHNSLVQSFVSQSIVHANTSALLYNQLNDYAGTLVKGYYTYKYGDIVEMLLSLLSKGTAHSRYNELRQDVMGLLNSLLENGERNPFVQNDLLKNRIDKFETISLGNASDNTIITTDYSKINNSLDVILRYATMDEAEEDRFRGLIKTYKMTFDKYSQDESVKQLRRDISKSYFDIYEAAIISSFESNKTPTILKMFFNFGYMDENLLGKDNSLMLYDMCENLEEADNVYTIYDWLKSIYEGVNEPSKNDFDQDYPAFLKSQLAGGVITENMYERYLNSNKEKLRFELRNFFKTGVKVCSGRPSNFCPVLSEHSIVKGLKSALISAKKIQDNWQHIKTLDYSLFYRDCIFSSSIYHIQREPISLEVMPKVILMPILGSRSILWQELSSTRRDSPARMAIPILTEEDLLLMQMKLAGEFRWEVCKKIQGARWNDVTDHSLTSDYFDYLQFYRKNNELSQDAKVKVKNQILACKNSFKNVFVSDYLLWIRYEADGSPRLSKFVRNMLSTYCPFPNERRTKLRNNPIYADIISSFENKQAKKYKLLSARYDKMKNPDLKPSLPLEITNYVDSFLL